MRPGTARGSRADFCKRAIASSSDPRAKFSTRPACGPRDFYFPLAYREEYSLVYLGKREEPMSKPSDLVQGTLDLLIMKILALEPLHGWAISQRLTQVSGDVLQV